MIHKHLRRCGLALLGAATIAGCSSSGTDNNNPGTIAVALSPTSGSAAQGGSVVTTATLTRGGSFTGTVDFTVAGAPTGVTAAVSNIATTGTTTTATVTINIAAATLQGIFPLVVHATGTGVTEATATYNLTVTVAASVSLSLSAPALTIIQGAATPTTTVTLTRTNFTGDVTLSVDNLPTGVSAGFAPANPQSGTSSVLTLTVLGTAPTGTFTNLAVRATGAGITAVTTPLSLTIAAPAASFSLSLSSAALSIVAGAATPTTTVTITRVNFPGDVALSVLNLPTGVTAAFAPANPQSGTSSVLTLTVGAGVIPGVFNTLAVQGIGTAGTVSTPLTLTVTAAAPVGNFTLTTTPTTTVNVTQGAAAVPVTVNVNRTGGNVSSITLTQTSVTALPAGLTLAFSAPNPTTANSGTLTVTAANSVLVGTYQIVIHGNTNGLVEQVISLTINVVAPGGSGNVNASFVGCDPSEKPAWFAFLNGTTGTWTQVIGTGDVFNFNITQPKGSLAYVTSLSGQTAIIVQSFTQAEFTAHTLTFCTPDPIGLETLNGVVANLAVGFTPRVSFGGRIAVPAGNGPFQLTSVPDGTFALVGYERNVATQGSGERVFIARGENPVNNGNFANQVNFTDATNSRPADVAAATMTGLGAETATFSTSFLTGSACTVSSLYSSVPAGGTFTLTGVPATLRVAGDLHLVGISSSDGFLSSFRSLIETFADVPTRAANPFIMPASLPFPTATDAGGPYKRPMVVYTAPAEFNIGHSLEYSDISFTGKSGFISASQGWMGGSSVTLVLPNFHGVGTFLDSYAPGTSDNLSFIATSSGSSGGVGGGLCTPGLRTVTAARSGTL